MKRRSFLTGSGTALGGSWISMGLPAVLASAVSACTAREEGSAFKVLSDFEAVEFSAIAAQIMPSGTTPGATEAGLIYFIDTVLAYTHADTLPDLRQGLAELQAETERTYQQGSFSRLDNQQQIETLQGIEDTDFFATMRFLIIAGTFSNPSYGGNRNTVGWQLIGFTGPGSSQPPFGHYDADYALKGE